MSLNFNRLSPGISFIEPEISVPGDGVSITPTVPRTSTPVEAPNASTSPLDDANSMMMRFTDTPNPIDIAMTGNPLQTFHYQFPSNLMGIGEEPYTLISIYESVTYGGAAPKLLGTIGLPVPANLSNIHTFRYDEVSMPIEAILANGTEWRGRDLENITASDAADIFQGFMTIGGLGSSIAGFNVLDQVEKWRKKIINPHMAALFKGVNFRKFTFPFSMIARNQGESDSIKQIVRKIQYHAHPGASDANTRFFLYPENFKISVFSKPGKAIFKTGLCVLGVVNINYNGLGVPVFFEDTYEPVNIAMELGFSEIELLTKEWLKAEAEGRV